MSWFNETICQRLHGPLFEELFVTARQDMYGLMCGLHAYKTRKYKSTVATDFHDCWPLPEDSSVNPLVYLCVAKTFIDTWINTLDENIA